MSAGAKQIASDVLSFLGAQRLDPTPANYTLGYHFVTDLHAALSAEIHEALSDGLRITQKHAAEMMTRFGLSTGASEGAATESAAELLRYQILRFADLTKSQTAAASRFSADLTAGQNSMGEAAGQFETIITSMIERTAAAERDLAAAAAETERLRQDLEAARTDANVDMLTGLPNRRAIEVYLTRLERGGEHRVIAFCDIDRFKRINDGYGHAAGDLVLKAVAQSLRKSCEGRGHVARWGGEEFVVVFANTLLADAGTIIDQARARVADKTFKLGQSDQPVSNISFSAGIAGGDGSTADIAAAADALLYQAKEGGRNQVAIEPARASLRD
jgi:diguanylate cyclase